MFPCRYTPNLVEEMQECSWLEGRNDIKRLFIPLNWRLQFTRDDIFRIVKEEKYKKNEKNKLVAFR